MDLLDVLSKVSVLNRDNGRVFTDTTRLDMIQELLDGSEYKRINDEGLFHLYSKKDIGSLCKKEVIVVSTHVDCEHHITCCFSERIGDGLLKGTYDNSITNAAILSLMLDHPLPDNVIVAFTGDEEETSIGSIQLARFLKRNGLKIKHIFVLDVTEVGWEKQADFTVENDFWDDDFGETIIEYAERSGYPWRFVPGEPDDIPEYVPGYRIEHIEAFEDESWDYDEHDIDCCSLCLPSKGEMHCDDGILVRESSFKVYTQVLGELLCLK
jgi:hypothetical protein